MQLILDDWKTEITSKTAKFTYNINPSLTTQEANKLTFKATLNEHDAENYSKIISSKIITGSLVTVNQLGQEPKTNSCFWSADLQQNVNYSLDKIQVLVKNKNHLILWHHQTTLEQQVILKSWKQKQIFDAANNILQLEPTLNPDVHWQQKVRLCMRFINQMVQLAKQDEIRTNTVFERIGNKLILTAHSLKPNRAYNLVRLFMGQRL